MLAPKTTKNQHFSRLPAPDRNCPPQTIAYHNIQLISYTAMLRPPSTPRYLENEEMWRQGRQQNNTRARVHETSELYGATFRHLYLWEKYHRCMNGFFPYVIYFFGTHHASAAINTSKIANIRQIHEKHMSRCANVKILTNRQTIDADIRSQNTHT